MKHLKLLIDGNIIEYDPACNFDGLTQGMTEPVKLEGSFSQEWKNRPKVLSFSSLSGKELCAQILKSDKGCVIPMEVLKQPVFCIQIIGKENGNKVSSTRYAIYLKGGRT